MWLLARVSDCRKSCIHTFGFQPSYGTLQLDVHTAEMPCYKGAFCRMQLTEELPCSIHEPLLAVQAQNRLLPMQQACTSAV